MEHFNVLIIGAGPSGSGPWRLNQNYVKDLSMLRYGRVNDGTVESADEVFWLAVLVQNSFADGKRL